MNFENVYQLCNKMGYFTYGSTQAYERMFDLVRMNAPIDVVAAVIWCNSDRDADLELITDQLKHLHIV